MLLSDNGAPGEVADRLLWRDAHQTLQRHAEPARDGRCVWCGVYWPCPARRLAERADAAARWGWRTWTGSAGTGYRAW
jgi:hypothetical protein